MGRGEEGQGRRDDLNRTPSKCWALSNGFYIYHFHLPLQLHFTLLKLHCHYLKTSSLFCSTGSYSTSIPNFLMKANRHILTDGICKETIYKRVEEHHQTVVW